MMNRLCSCMFIWAYANVNTYRSTSFNEMRPYLIYHSRIFMIVNSYVMYIVDSKYPPVNEHGK